MTSTPIAEAVAPDQDQRIPPSPARTAIEGESRRRAGRRLLVIGVLAVVALAVALAAGTVPRLRQEQQVNAAAAGVAAALPRVTVAVARPMPADTGRVLPGNALPLLEAALYARATGYIKERRVDIGDRVEPNQLLAVIDAPDIDDQPARARPTWSWHGRHYG